LRVRLVAISVVATNGGGELALRACAIAKLGLPGLDSSWRCGR
jgi:hypothetical protein